MPYSSSLSDKEWEIIEPLLPQKKKTRPSIWTKRQILDGIFYQLKHGCNWCDLPCILAPLLAATCHPLNCDGQSSSIFCTLLKLERAEALAQALSDALSLITDKNAAGWFAHCGLFN